MSRRAFQRVPVRRADFGPAQPGYRITCGACRATDEVIVKGTLDDVAQRFRAGGWVVGKRESDDLCSACAPTQRAVARPSKGDLPMVKTASPPVASAAPVPPAQRSEEARVARLIVDQLLVDHFEPARGKYHEGWSDDRVAKEATMSLEFVQKRRDAEHGALKHDVEPEKLTALLADFGAKEAVLRDVTIEASAHLRGALAVLDSALQDVRLAMASHMASLKRVIDGK